MLLLVESILEGFTTSWWAKGVGFMYELTCSGLLLFLGLSGEIDAVGFRLYC